MAQWQRLRLFPEVSPVPTKQQMAHTTKGKTEPPDHEKYFRRGGTLDISICPDEVAATRVAIEAYRLLNKFPREINVSDFPEEINVNDRKAKDCQTRKLLELMSLRALKTDFDFRDIRYVFRFSRASPGAYLLTPAPWNVHTPSHSRAHEYTVTLPAFPPNSKGPYKSRSHLWPVVHFSDNQFTKEVIDNLPEVPYWWGFRPNAPSNATLYKTANIPVESIRKLIT